MRIVVLGGTGFVGRTIVAALEAAGHSVLVVHRGQHELEAAGPSEHTHLERDDVPGLRAELTRFEAEALIDGIALTARHADDTLSAIPDGLRLLVLSSMDVYRAFGSLHAGIETDPVPLDETSPVREQRYPYRGKIPNLADYEKLDVEERYLARGGTVIRLPMIYGEHDPQHREEPVLRRIRAGREQLPIGAGNWLWTRGYVHDMAAGIRLAIETPEAAGEILNLGDTRASTIRAWFEQIVAAAGASLELVRVQESALPPDLGLTAAVAQHLVVDSAKARRMLGWEPGDPAENVGRSVAWHLAHPPADLDRDFSADERALESPELP